PAPDRVSPPATRHLGDLHAQARRGPVPVPAARARVGLRIREPLKRRRLLHPPPASKGRPAIRGGGQRDGGRGGLPPRGGAAALSRLPIRLRVTLVFSAVMAV